MKGSKRGATGSGQLSLLLSKPKATKVMVGRVRFRDPNPSLILINNTPLRAMLESAGEGFVLELRELFRSLDWSEFENKYQAGGRDPFHPALMMSLILFGTLNGHRSLRELEQFALTDIRCWWLSGGEAPDYTTFAKFLTRHQEYISGGFFELVTSKILKERKSSAKSIAIDGTVMQACGSRLRTISAEAARVEAERARQEADDSDDDPKAQAKAEQAENVASAAAKVAENQKHKGRPNQSGRVCRSEPEAVIRKLKSGGVAPSYIASAACNDDRIVTGLAVDPSSETQVVEAMLDQSERCTGERVDQVLADAGYMGNTVLQQAVERDIDLLCPEGKARGDDDWLKEEGGKVFPKSAFAYDEQTDTYRCPAGEFLHNTGLHEKARDGQQMTIYRASNCGACPLRKRCTTARNRAVKRYESDSMKEVLRQVMSDPRARARYRRRNTMVEPVFGELRYIQGLNRFGRRGRLGATLEWALHCTAHNLRRHYQLALRAAAALLSALLATIMATIMATGFFRAARTPNSRRGTAFPEKA